MSQFGDSSIYGLEATKILGREKKDNERVSYSVDFSGKSENSCVGLVDIVNSTRIVAILKQEQMSKYYEIFLNSMANIVERFGGYVIKNIGDCLLYYFPELSKSHPRSGSLNCIECSIEMIDSHELINNKLKSEGLPLINYRVSADFGKVTIIKSDFSSTVDIVGVPVNICSKINSSAIVNGAVIGSDLYQIVKNSDDYHFSQIKAYSVGLKQKYPVYSVKKKN